MRGTGVSSGVLTLQHGAADDLRTELKAGALSPGSTGPLCYGCSRDPMANHARVMVSAARRFGEMTLFGAGLMANALR